jgi:hypothetical protein
VLGREKGVKLLFVSDNAGVYIERVFTQFSFFIVHIFRV